MRRFLLALVLALMILAGGIAMAHGRPDYGVGGKKVTTFALDDMAELAARLGSIVTFDRRGDVIWLDDFEDNINKWEQSTPGAGASIALSTEAAHNGAKSCKIVDGSDNWWSAITRVLGIPVVSKTGSELSFADQDDDTKLELRSQFYNGTDIYRAAIRYVPDEGNFDVEDETLGWVTLASGISIPSHVYAWQTMKLVWDLDSKKYVRAILNDTEYDLSAYTPVDVGTSAVRQLIIDIYLWPEVTGGNRHGYVDDFILTQNEP